MNGIIVKNLNKTFDGKTVLSNVNFEVEERQSLAIIGGSGSGKSVLIKCIAGLLVPDNNSTITIEGEEVGNQHISKRHAFKDKFAMLFQGNALFDSMTIWENITFGMSIEPKHAQKFASEKLTLVEIDPKVVNLYPSEISGGMQKRVALARAIAQEPKIIFFDEPTSGLDPATSKSISNLIKELRYRLKATIITVTHDNKCMKIVADKVAVINQGTISWFGSISETSTSKDAYLRDFLE